MYEIEYYTESDYCPVLEFISQLNPKASKNLARN